MHFTFLSFPLRVTQIALGSQSLAALIDPDVTVYILTERLCFAWLGDFKAKVIVDEPTRANIVGGKEV